MVRTLPTLALAAIISSSLGISAVLAADAPAKPGKTASGTPTTANERTAESSVVKGILLNASSGAPVGGARVILASDGTRSTISDAAGHFRFKNVGPCEFGYMLWAYAGNLIAPKTRVVELPDSASGANRFAPLRLTMVEGKQAKFVVRAKAGGQAVVGARIWFDWPDHRKLVTGADGTALTAGLLPDVYQVEILRDGFARTSASIDVSRAPSVEECDVAMADGGVVRGVVVDEAGKPLAGVPIYYRSESAGFGWSGDKEKTDRNGRFQDRFAPLNTPFQISASKPKFFDQLQSVVLLSNKKEAELRFVLKRLPKGGSVVGRVTGPNGHSINGARISNYNNSWELGSATKTDTDGRFRLDDLRKGWDDAFTIAVSAKGFAPQMVPVKPGTSDHPAEVAIRLETGHSIHGRVVGENGKPLPHVVLMVESPAYPLNLGPRYSTDRNGEFALDSLPSDAKIALWSPAGIGVRDTHWKLDIPQPVSYTLASPALIRGMVVDAETGKAVPGFHLQLDFCSQRAQGDPGPLELNSFDGKWFRTGFDFHAKDGRFTIKPLGNHNPFELIVEADGYERNVVPRVVAATPDEAKDLKIALLPITAADLSTIHGKLVDYRGNGITGAHVHLIVTSKPTDSTEGNKFNWRLVEKEPSERMADCVQSISLSTDKGGCFQFSKVLPDKYVQLEYWGKGAPKGRWTAPAKSRPGNDISATINVPQPAAVRGTIDRSKFADAGSIILMMDDRSHTLEYDVQLDAQRSTFEFPDLAPGSYSVRVLSKTITTVQNGVKTWTNRSLASQDVFLRAGDVSEVRFTQPNK